MREVNLFAFDKGNVKILNEDNAQAKQKPKAAAECTSEAEP